MRDASATRCTHHFSENVMATVMFMSWPEITPDLYDAAREAVNWEGDPAPGGKFHVAWMGEDGFHALDIWESPEAFQRFANERLMPGLAPLGLTTQPTVQMAEAHRIFVPDPEAVSS
jgi:hypothetical protein